MITNFNHWKTLNESKNEEEQVKKNGYLIFYIMFRLQKINHLY